MNGFHMLMPEEYRALISLVPHEHGAPAADEEECSRLCDELLDFLLQERGMIAAFNLPYPEKRKLIRRYENTRPAAPLPEHFLAAQDKLFWTETLRRGVFCGAGGDCSVSGGYYPAERRRHRQFRFGSADGVQHSLARLRG